MTHYATCQGCQSKKACSKLASIRKAVKSIGLTSVKFKCDERIPLYHRGQRVITNWPLIDSDGYWGEGSLEYNSWPSTIIRESGSRFVVNIDNVDSDFECPAKEYFKNENLFARCPKNRLTPLDEPDYHVCGFCDEPHPSSQEHKCMTDF